MNYKTTQKKERTKMRRLNQQSELDNIQVGDHRIVYDYKCVCTYKSKTFVVFHTLLKNGNIGKKNTSFLKCAFEYLHGGEWKNTNKTSTKFVNR
tara:strand:+ start:405 stop:686 length:282 start_codon:yes stop_codon:yes gene_type:complete